MRKTYSNAMRFKWWKIVGGWAVYDIEDGWNVRGFKTKDEAIKEAKLFNKIYHLGRQAQWEESNKNAQRIMSHLGI